MGTKDRIRKVLQVYQAAGSFDRGATQELIDDSTYPSSPPPPPNPSTTFSLPSSSNSPPGLNSLYYNQHHPPPQNNAFGYLTQPLGYNNNPQEPPNNQYGHPRMDHQLQSAQQSQQTYQYSLPCRPSSGNQRPSMDHQPSTFSLGYTQEPNGSGDLSRPQCNAQVPQQQYNSTPAYNPQPQGSPVYDTQSLYTSPPSQNNNSHGYSMEMPSRPPRSQTLPNMGHRTIMRCGHDAQCYDA